MTLTDTDLHDAKNPEDWVCGQGMNDRELTQIVQNHTGYPWFNGKAYVEYHGIDVNQARIAELEAALQSILEIPNSEAAQGIMKVYARAALEDGS
jgi:hypothetical protein